MKRDEASRPMLLCRESLESSGTDTADNHPLHPHLVPFNSSRVPPMKENLLLLEDQVSELGCPPALLPYRADLDDDPFMGFVPPEDSSSISSFPAVSTSAGLYPTPASVEQSDPFPLMELNGRTQQLHAHLHFHHFHQHHRTQQQQQVQVQEQHYSPATWTPSGSLDTEPPRASSQDGTPPPASPPPPPTSGPTKQPKKRKTAEDTTGARKNSRRRSTRQHRVTSNSASSSDASESAPTTTTEEGDKNAVAGATGASRARRSCDTRQQQPTTEEAILRTRRQIQLALELEEGEDDSVLDDPNLSRREKNKISAFRYRRKRKMYVLRLETEVTNLNEQVKFAEEELTKVREENEKLRAKVAKLTNRLKEKSLPLSGAAAGSGAFHSMQIDDPTTAAHSAPPGAPAQPQQQQPQSEEYGPSLYPLRKKGRYKNKILTTTGLLLAVVILILNPFFGSIPLYSNRPGDTLNVHGADPAALHVPHSQGAVVGSGDMHPFRAVVDHHHHHRQEVRINSLESGTDLQRRSLHVKTFASEVRPEASAPSLSGHTQSRSAHHSAS